MPETHSVTAKREEVVLRPSASLSLNLVLPAVVGIITVTAFFYQHARDMRVESDAKYETKAMHAADVDRLEQVHSAQMEGIEQRLDRILNKLDKL